MSSHAREAMGRLLDRLDLPRDAGERVAFSGADPVVVSRLRYGAAGAAALGAHAAGVMALAELRGTGPQAAELDLGRVVHLGMRSAYHLRQNGRGFQVGSRSRTENFFRTRDGRMIYLLRNNRRGTITEDLIGLLQCANDTAGIASAVAGWDAHELEEELARRKLPGVIARSPEEWRRHPQGRLLAGQPGVTLEKTADSPRRALPRAARPMAGLRVLDVSHVIAGPALGRLLAEQGGDVLQIVKPSEQETIPVQIDSCLGKRSAFLDLDHPQDAETLRNLVREADIFIQSWRPGALDRRGFGVADVAALNPGIIHVSISCYGHTGPWATRGGYEPIGQAASGPCFEEGTPEMPLNAPTGTMNDYLAAWLAGAGVMAALLRQCAEGGAWHVATSLAQASMWVLDQGRLADRPNRDAPPAIGADDLWTRACAFGEVTHVAPLIRYARTPGHWDLPPQPAGASQARWLTRPVGGASQ